MLTFNCTTKLDSSAHSNIFPECPSELATTVTLQIQYSTALYITMNLNRIASAQQQGKFYLPLFGISLSSLDDEINQLLGGFHLLMCQNNHKKRGSLHSIFNLLKLYSLESHIHSARAIDSLSISADGTNYHTPEYRLSPKHTQTAHINMNQEA